VIDNALAAGNPIPDELAPRAEVRRQALANGTANREAAKPFPDAFQQTESMGWIPDGWEALPFGNLLENTIGGDWGKETEDEKHTFPSVIIRGTDMPHILAGNRSSAPKRWVEPKKFATRELQDSDIVIEISGGSPTQSTGRSLYITDHIIRRLGGSVEPASFCRKFRPLNRFYGLYGGLHLAAIYKKGKMWEYQNQSTGISNFQTTSFLEREFVAIPAGSELMEVFYDKARPFLDKMTSNQQEKLAKLRDTLLPKLISGELRIPEAEQLTEEVLA
jgi:type I restriction enzyme S subunit